MATLVFGERENKMHLVVIVIFRCIRVASRRDGPLHCESLTCINDGKGIQRYPHFKISHLTRTLHM